MPIDTKSLFPDQDALVATLYRLEGLADAIFAVAETGATEVIAEGAMFGIQSALKRDLTDLREAASGWDIVVPAPAPAAEAPALAALIEAHRAAVAAMDADKADSPPPELVAAEDAALDALAALPVDDAQFLVKLRYMVADHRRVFGPNHKNERADEILTALTLHFEREA